MALVVLAAALAGVLLAGGGGAGQPAGAVLTGSIGQNEVINDRQGCQVITRQLTSGASVFTVADAPTA